MIKIEHEHSSSAVIYQYYMTGFEKAIQNSTFRNVYEYEFE